MFLVPQEAVLYAFLLCVANLWFMAQRISLDAQQPTPKKLSHKPHRVISQAIKLSSTHKLPAARHGERRDLHGVPGDGDYPGGYWN